ncbi:DUF3850 domain-containing protein [Microbacterium lacticum]
MALHELKSWPEFFGPLSAGVRTHELRRNDRDYQIGDQLLLKEYLPDAESFTGAELLLEITSLTSSQIPCAVSAEGLHQDFCILSVTRPDPAI